MCRVLESNGLQCSYGVGALGGGRKTLQQTIDQSISIFHVLSRCQAVAGIRSAPCRSHGDTDDDTTQALPNNCTEYGVLKQLTLYVKNSVSENNADGYRPSSERYNERKGRGRVDPCCERTALITMWFKWQLLPIFASFHPSPPFPMGGHTYISTFDC
ncbi:uncharacterized protein BO72DRAFT_82401 [Aspergillus fijiensis CBS 313.89]|uniref:Uncharacterized protein n=1 Tax=Aspergillus fijiensis CBS 313.89 TaxID=1448319 RepID=A0A8G1RWA0_9EURO|nr:uncharacterized protein BO72DRAFT_82401 [Aspergillus fijiensis CBS 313.89]RAK77961.1 hypothetical protein BO72DRAFT_82401 [Aspergillus fijiensis CBS 313.89]